MKIVAKLDAKPFHEILQERGLQSGGAVQSFLDAEVIRQCTPYVPFDNGVLNASAWTATDIGSGLVVYNTPYAHYQYYGEVYGPNFKVNIGGEEVWRSPKGQKKSPTGEKLKYNTGQHPQAGSHWFDRMIADRKDDLLDAVRKRAGALDG